MPDSTQRFTDRVDNYTKYRPGYPLQVLELLRSKGNLTAGSVIADIGAGTGIFTKLLLDQGYHVTAVEPNDAMRRAADNAFTSISAYHSINGTAESTNIASHTIDMIVCAQAFHWFDAQHCRTEFSRILKPGALVALIWNNRQVDVDEFSISYELSLQAQAGDYKRVNHQNLTGADYGAFFKGGKYQLFKFPNAQVFDETGLIGRAFSSSYVPAGHTPEGEIFLRKLKAIFQQHQVNGTVNVTYQTEVYLGEV